jgi:NAD+ diphosphatase
LEQRVIESPHADRVANMRRFADAAAEMATEVIVKEYGLELIDDSLHPVSLRLDRAVHLRSEPEALADLEPQALYLILSGHEILVDEANIHQLSMLTHDSVRHLQGNLTFLGLLKNNSKEHRTPVFSLDLPEKVPLVGYCYIDTRTGAPLFEPLHNELALHATAYAQWQRRSAFCNLCGSHNELEDGGTARICSSCSNKTWPRQDPSIIVAVSSRDGKRILLARSKRHPVKVHTVLAGFVEAGETLEAAVAREVFEETGIRIDEGSCKYIGSQPWPFPQSCMIAFTCTADSSQTLSIDREEIVSASWFDRAQVRQAATVEGATMQAEVAKAALEANPGLELLIPPKQVVARTLIDYWIDYR